MVHKNQFNHGRGQCWALAFCLLAPMTTVTSAAPAKQEDSVTGEKQKIPFALRQAFLAANTKGVDTTRRWVSMIIGYEVEETQLKALSFQIAEGSNSLSMPPHFVVVNEVSLAPGEKARDEVEDATGKPARLILTLVSITPLTRKSNNEMVTRVVAVNVASALSGKLLKVEIRNDHPRVQAIKNWIEDGNYFYKKSEEGDLPALKVGEIKAAAASAKGAARPGRQTTLE